MCWRYGGRLPPVSFSLLLGNSQAYCGFSHPCKGPDNLTVYFEPSGTDI